ASGTDKAESSENERKAEVTHLVALT
ncbi:MAG: hypothetical protein JWN34_5313, partial [Bryobacterales bacterium]|nr:hypothetical protein [Bryobacterales bacterium]